MNILVFKYHSDNWNVRREFCNSNYGNYYCNRCSRTTTTKATQKKSHKLLKKQLLDGLCYSKIGPPYHASTLSKGWPTTRTCVALPPFLFIDPWPQIFSPLRLLLVFFPFFHFFESMNFTFHWSSKVLKSFQINLCQISLSFRNNIFSSSFQENQFLSFACLRQNFLVALTCSFTQFVSIFSQLLEDHHHHHFQGTQSSHFFSQFFFSPFLCNRIIKKHIWKKGV
jgi:hypothetical protein